MGKPQSKPKPQPKPRPKTPSDKNEHFVGNVKSAWDKQRKDIQKIFDE